MRLEQIAEKLLKKYGVACGASIAKHGDRLIYGDEFVEALREYESNRKENHMATNSSNVSRKSIQKLTLGPSKPITARNSLVGCIIVGDYIDPMNAQRTLMLERVKAQADSPAPKRASRTAATEEPLAVGSAK